MRQGALSIRETASLLVTVGGKRKEVVGSCAFSRCCSLSNLGVELSKKNHTVACMVLKATGNDRCATSPDEFRGLLSDVIFD
ncbi:hypothetical protein TNCV_1721 [Trichonephila clavipes]|nr:hypothetical protein TNCV_1721 [Trichonephila clavipes]